MARRSSFNVDATEKLYADFQLTATNPGGHSSLPVPDNAIYHIADALTRLQAYTFPFELNAVTRAYFARMSTLESGQTAADMKAILKTRLRRRPSRGFRRSRITTPSCAPLAWPRGSAGRANNALPQTAQAIVNCRILPGHSTGRDSPAANPDFQ